MAFSAPGRYRRRAIGVGLTAATVVCLAAAVGTFRGLENLGYDLSFRLLGGMDPDPRIVKVDIDDSALDQNGRWPWNRRVLADAINALSRLGAGAIVLDVNITQPQPPRLDTVPTPALPGAEADATDSPSSPHPPPSIAPATTPAPPPPTDSRAQWVFDDQELTAAIARAGNVIVPLRFQPASSDAPPGALPVTLMPALNALCRRFDLDEAELRRLAGWPDEGPPFPTALLKRHAAETLANAYLENHPDADLAAFLQDALPGQSPSNMNRDRQELTNAYQSRLAGLAVLERLPTVPDALADRIMVGIQLASPIAPIGRAARAVGSVVVEYRGPDAVVRDVPLLVRVAGRLIPQLTLAAAAELLDLDLTSARYDGDDLVIADRSGTERIRAPINAAGESPVNWQMPPGAPDHRWGRTLTLDVPINRVLEIIDAEQAIETNAVTEAYYRSRIVELRHATTPAAGNDYQRAVREQNELKRKLRRTADPARRKQIEHRLDELLATINREQQAAMGWFRFVRGQCDTQEDDQTPSQECHDTEQYVAWFSPEAVARRADRRDRLEARFKRLSTALEPRIKDKIVLIGLVASSVADFVATPVDPHAPGAYVHASLLDTLLNNRFPRRAGRTATLVMTALLCIFISLVTATKPLGQSLIALAAGCALPIAAAAVLFQTRWIVLAWPVAVTGVIVVWACVTAYRRLTEERARRRITNVLGQYTSHAVATGIAEQIDERGFQPQRAHVTCFFSDLQDFTTLSERLGPERTRDLLNPYLRLISDTLIEHNALVNKFIGDGVFAFFNAPILPCEQHAEAGCSAAWTGLQRFDRQFRSRVDPAHGGPTDPKPISMNLRIGLATGEAAVGDFGTDTRKDYTSIGDTVNVAARLEAANKTLRTRILADEATRDGAEPHWLWRSVGHLLVPGRRAPIAAFELVMPDSPPIDTPRPDTDPPLAGANPPAIDPRPWIDTFEQALRRFHQRDWRGASQRWNQCLAVRPNDGPTRFYLDLAAQYATTAPADDWTGAICITGRNDPHNPPPPS